MEIFYRDKNIEQIDRRSLEELQYKQLIYTLGFALRTPFYKTRLAQSGIYSPADIKSLKDLKKIPFTTKDDLRECYTQGLLSTSIDNVVRIHTSSGTTGVPTVIYHTQEDLNNWTDLVARSITACGVTKKDVFQNMMTYGMFTGGLGLHYGAERIGILVIPTSSGNTKRQLQIMKDFKTTVVHATPSYMFHMYSKLNEYGFKLEDLHLKKAFVGAEPYSENSRKKIEEIFNIDVYNSYGLSEMNGPGVAFECVYKNGMHIWEDSYIVEVIDPKTEEPVKEGAEGELVLTTLKREATPILRYRTRDLALIYKDSCPCERTHRRLSRITGRTDDMLIVNGVNVFPSQIEQVIMEIPEVGNNYMINLSKQGAMDKLTVKVEIYSKLFHGDISELEHLKAKIKDNLRASIIINPNVELHEPGSLPVFELKAKRVEDERPKL
ncbi:Phenylacetate--CoA ligase [sediment metagenome]|uniref:Phenylacetate--CoA ligase n=1 Tax=sediment metagenome TaxID=749907 RepID=D9PF00_9ZZZZ